MARIVRETDTGYRKKSIDRIRSRIRLYGNELPPWHTPGQKIHDPAGPSAVSYTHLTDGDDRAGLVDSVEIVS